MYMHHLTYLYTYAILYIYIHTPSYISINMDHPIYLCACIILYIYIDTPSYISMYTHHSIYLYRYTILYIYKHGSSIYLCTRSKYISMYTIILYIYVHTSPYISMYTHHPIYLCTHMHTFTTQVRTI